MSPSWDPITRIDHPASRTIQFSPAEVEPLPARLCSKSFVAHQSSIMASKQESKYWMESEGERKRLASNHFIAKDAMGGKLVRASVDFSRPVRILDSGTTDGQ